MAERLVFDDNFDLQTRLLLLPYNDEECIGAIVAYYQPKVTADECTAPLQVNQRQAENYCEEKKHESKDSALEICLEAPTDTRESVLKGFESSSDLLDTCQSVNDNCNDGDDKPRHCNDDTAQHDVNELTTAFRDLDDSVSRAEAVDHIHADAQTMAKATISDIDSNEDHNKGHFGAASAKEEENSMPTDTSDTLVESTLCSVLQLSNKELENNCAPIAVDAENQDEDDNLTLIINTDSAAVSSQDSPDSLLQLNGRDSEKESSLTPADATRSKGEEVSTSNSVVVPTNNSPSLYCKPENESALITPPKFEIVGSILTGIQGIATIQGKNTDWTQQDFTFILSSIREAPTPIALMFQRPAIIPAIYPLQNNGNESLSHQSMQETDIQNVGDEDVEPPLSSRRKRDDVGNCSNTFNTTSKCSTDCDDQRTPPAPIKQDVSSKSTTAMTPATSNATRALGARLSQWGNRVLSTSEKLAAEAAARATIAVNAATEVVNERQERLRMESSAGEIGGAATDLGKRIVATTMAIASATPTEVTESTLRSPPPPPPTKRALPKLNPYCSLYLQMNSGKFVLLQEDSHERAVTNSSVLLIRASSTKPCPARGYSYQWYRSYGAKEGDTQNKTTKWFILAGATYAAFQPSATDVGHRVRCVITIEKEQRSMLDTPGPPPVTVMCELPCQIESDPSLLNAARQSFVPGGGGESGGSFGASFGNLMGCGSAEGRMFRIRLEMGRRGSVVKRKSILSSEEDEAGPVMHVFQVSGSTAEPLHDMHEPIVKATAVADASQPRSFEVIFMFGLPQSATLLSALCEDNRLKLTALNRGTRESFLLALGIVNFAGKPSELNAKTILFPEAPPGALFVKSDEPFDKYDSEKGKSIDFDKGILDDDKEDVETNSQQVRQHQQETSPPNSRKDTDTDIFESPAALSTKTTPLENELEKDMILLREELADKDKVVSNLQRRLARSEAETAKVQKELQLAQDEVNSSKADYKECFTSLRLTERRIETHETDMVRVKKDFSSRISSLEGELTKRINSETELEKVVRALNNEKAVLFAAVGARDNKLTTMQQMQEELSNLKVEVARGTIVQQELNLMTSKCKEANAMLSATKAAETHLQAQVVEMKASAEKLTHAVDIERKRAAAATAETDDARSQVQKLRTERNSYKQKADSLSKEMSRICRNGMGISEIERIIQDHENLKQELSLLTSQKRKVLIELEEYRMLYERSLYAREQAGVDGEAIRALEQRAELERVVSDLTEYLNAKEMQLETMKEVNWTLTEELRLLAMTHLSKNDI